MGWTTELFKTSFVFESNDDENKNEDDVQEELEAAGDSEDDGQEKLEAADDNYASLDPLGIAEKSEAQEAGVAKRGSKAQEALDAKDSGAGESGSPSTHLADPHCSPERTAGGIGRSGISRHS